MFCVKGNTFFELNTESKETTVRKKQWYVAHVLCITLSYYYFFLTEKIEGSRRGPEREVQKGVQVLSTPVYTTSDVHRQLSNVTLFRHI